MIPSTAVIDSDAMITLSRNFRVGNFIDITLLVGFSPIPTIRTADPPRLSTRTQPHAAFLLNPADGAGKWKLSTGTQFRMRPKPARDEYPRRCSSVRPVAE
jgi:hypothetical protein